MSRRAFLFAIVATAVISAGAALLIGQQLEPPSTGADASAPDPSRITVPVEKRTLSSNVVTRGTIEFSDSRSLRVETNAGDVPVVTGAPAEVGTELNEGDLLLEVGYRPVVLMEGELPMFRSLGPGSEGEDVEQLEAGLVRLGFDPGPVDGIYDTATEDAVSQWYTQLGYDAPEQSASEKQALEQAEEAVTQANDTVTQATTALNQAQTGPSNGERLDLQIAVEEASNALKELKESGAERLEIRRAEVAVVQARERQTDALRKDTSVEARTLVSARDALLKAELNLGELQVESGLRIPRAEIVFVPSLPRRIDVVKAEKGEILTDPDVVSVSSAEVRVTSSVTAADRPLVSEGDVVEIVDDGVGLATTGTISFIADQPGGLAPEGKYFMRITPDGDEASDYQGVNVRLTVPVESTSGDVLAVPAAALSATADGTARVEVELADETTKFVTVEAGLSSRGFVEVTPSDGELNEGDRVVIGFESESTASTASNSSSDETDDTETDDTETDDTDDTDDSADPESSS